MINVISYLNQLPQLGDDSIVLMSYPGRTDGYSIFFFQPFENGIERLKSVGLMLILREESKHLHSFRTQPVYLFIYSQPAVGVDGGSRYQLGMCCTGLQGFIITLYEVIEYTPERADYEISDPVGDAAFSRTDARLDVSWR